MAETKPISWRVNYAAFWRPLANNQAEAWEEFLEANLHGGLRPGEMNKAVASLCDEHKKEGSPNVREVMFTIIRMRNTWRGKPGEEPRQHFTRRCLCDDGSIFLEPEGESTPWGTHPKGVFTPCKCAEGKAIMEFYFREEDFPTLRIEARLAYAQQEQREIDVEKDLASMPPGKTMRKLMSRLSSHMLSRP